ncbi:MAG: ATP-dependent helicase [Treponema sp.]|nr:ATP-dependent helicase [Treponema sp.]
MADALPSYLEVLNPEQRKAVLHNGKNLLILAGAGSGKTRVITTKIVYLIRERGLDPRSIMAVTFTNKAAREMTERARLIDMRAGDAMMRTFHSFGAWFLRRNASLAGLNSNFVIYDDEDTVSLLRTINEDAARAENRKTAALISRAKDYFLSPDDPELDLIDYRPEFRKIYFRYEERLKKIGNADFGDLIKKPVEILKANPDVAQRFHDRFKVIMVDEYQDSNIAQFKLLAELSGPETYLCVVGDDDQSIYRFRGAEVRNILEFSDRFPGTDIIRLERNYRSFAPILAAASSVVDNNSGRLGKKLSAERGSGKLPTLAFLYDQDEEASFCAELIQRSVNTAHYLDWAILYRTNAQSLGFETELLRRNIPYKVVGSLKFYEREEIKDALALFALLLNPLDEVAFRRIINKPTRGIGAAAQDKILEATYINPPQEGGILATAQSVSLSAKAKAGVDVFISFMGRAKELLNTGNTADQKSVGKTAAAKAKKTAISGDSPIRSGEGLSVCAAALILDSGLAEYHSSHDEINAYQRAGNLQELVNAASVYPASIEGLTEFLEHIELDRAIQEDKESNLDYVTLITLHNTKGLEFKRVIMTGLEQGIFPREDKEGDDLEEERRLFYVGATRAMDELYFCSCAFRRMYGRTSPMMPSRFLYEVDRSNLRIIGKPPISFGTGKTSSNDDYAYRGSNFNQSNFGKVNYGRAAKVSSDGKWKQGDRIFHDDQGYGAVVDISESDDGPVVKVRFDNGQEKRFLSLYQSGNFTKMENDDKGH